MYICMYTCIHTYIHSCIESYNSMYIYIYTYIHVFSEMLLPYGYIYIYTCIYIYVYGFVWKDGTWWIFIFLANSGGLPHIAYDRISGWWLGHPCEKYEFVSGDDEIPNISGKMPNWWQPNHQPVGDYSSWLDYDPIIMMFFLIIFL